MSVIPYPFQRRVADLLLGGHNVILQAPTGAGKTRAALDPFLYPLTQADAAAFPRQCIYSVPMRVLVNQFGAEYKGNLSRYGRALRRGVTVQTGDRPEDPCFEGDLVFCTIDQALSSLLGVPYSLPAGRANLNAGALVGSYLVFDEFHLFPVEEDGQGALATTLQLLRVLKDLTPFTLMTATFSTRMLDALAELLGATPVTVEGAELETVETQWNTRPRRERRFFVVDGTLDDAGAVLAAHGGRRRSIAVRNTVERALELYGRLVESGCRPVPFADPRLEDSYRSINQAHDAEERQRALDGATERLLEIIGGERGWEQATWLVLLHSRFTRAHRDLKEELVRREFGPRDKRAWRLPSLILVATQAVEVGLDITSDVLHTELAPAASVLQRAGRCGRFPGETGSVYVYRLPPARDGRPDCAPYVTTAERETCDLTWKSLQERHDSIVRFPDEQEVVDRAHTHADGRMLQAMSQAESGIWGDIVRCVVQRDVSARRSLIRRVDSRTLIVHEPPAGLTDESPYRYEGFSLWHGTLRGKVRDLREREGEGEPALRFPCPVDGGEESREATVYRWLPVNQASDISASLLFAVRPDLVEYDANRGLRFVEQGEGGTYRSAVLPPNRGGDARAYDYRLESYRDHVASMVRVYEHDMRDRLLHLARRLTEHPDCAARVPAGLLDRAIRLALALHDLGKLQVEWQQWARAYQERVTGARPAFLVAHTLSASDEHRRIAREVHPKRPHHAGEGAWAGLKVAARALDAGAHPGLFLATITAIAHHHSPGVDKASPFRLDAEAGAALADALAAAGDDAWRAWASHLLTASDAPDLRRYLLGAPPEADWRWWMLYFVIVRAVRLADAGAGQFASPEAPAPEPAWH